MSNVGSGPETRGRIIVVDESATSLGLLTDILKGDDYAVTPIGMPDQVLSAVRSKLPDLILYNLRMNTTDGLEICRELKNDLKTREIPVIFISGSTDSAERLKTFEAGGVDHISKPFDAMELLLRISTQLTLWRTKKELMERNRQLREEINERHRIEQDLVESERLHRLLADNTSDIIWTMNMDFVFTYVNPAIHNVTGFTPAEWMGTRLSSHCDEENFSLMLQAAMDEIAKGPNSPGTVFEAVMLKKNREPMPVEIHAKFVYGDKGNPVALQGSTWDISERKKSEERLRKSEEKYRDLVENINDVIYEVDKNAFISYVSPAAYSLSGYTRDELIGKSIYDLIHGEDIPRIQKQFQKVISGVQEPSKYRFIKKNGEIIWCYSSSRVFYENGVPQGLRGSMTDISQMVQMESELRQAQKMEAIGTLAGGIAHDFNNILFPIVGLSELLMEDLPADSREHENVSEIYIAAKRASELVKQILSFSRQVENKPIPVNIQQIVKELFKLARATIPTNIRLIQNIQNNCRPLMADPSQLHQIAMNLITNAYHAVEDRDGGEISISLKEVEVFPERDMETVLKPGIYAMLAVSDNGCGMDAEVMGKIFQPYFTTKKFGKGTGLGLSVVHGIVNDLGGDIQVSSQKGIGTTFSVFLPLPEKLEEIHSTQETGSYKMGVERLLLVDDEIAIARLEQMMLERYGYQIVPKTSSLEALEAFSADPQGFDLVITDMSMPDLTGEELSKRILAIRPGVPIIICTGFSEKLSPERAVEIGISGYLMKPVVKSELAGMVRKVLDSH